ncbi:DUF551 domain-containing protein, partial [Escherichia coli]
MTTNNHPAHGPVSLDRLHQISEILSKAAAQSDGGNLGYAMADAVKVIDGAIAAFGAEPVAWRYRYVHTPKTEENGSPFTTEWKLCDSEDECNPSDCFERQPLYVAPPAPGAVPEVGPVAYIFKHPAGRLFWSLTDESNKWQSDVMPVYASPAPAFVPPAIEPDYEVIKGILPTANPDEYACCIAADMWNACRAAMLQAGNSPVTPDGWIPVSERMPDDDDFVYIWPRPDFGIELHVGQYCECHPKGDGWYAQVYEQNYGIEWHPI